MNPSLSQTSLMPTAYLPPVYYFVLLSGSKHLQIELSETYPKQTIRNHCTIATANGIQKLSIPVKKPNGNKSKTEDIEIINDGKWHKIHWRALSTAYNKSPFFEHYCDGFRTILEKQHTRLYHLNFELLQLVLSLLKLDVSLDFCTDWKDSYLDINDLRKVDFESVHGNTLLFSTYYQVFFDRQAFLPNMSVVDLLFNTGPDARSYLLMHHYRMIQSLSEKNSDT